jgi:hypothetical protein
LTCVATGVEPLANKRSAIIRVNPKTEPEDSNLIRKETAMFNYLIQECRGVLFEELGVEEVVAPRS